MRKRTRSIRFVWLLAALCLAASAAAPAGAIPPPRALPWAVDINEIELGAGDWIEIYNTSTAPAYMTGWQLLLSDASGWSRIYTFPQLTLPAGSYVVVHEGGSAADDTATELHTGWEIPWVNGGVGAAELLDGGPWTADYVEFGQEQSFAPMYAVSWRGSYGAVTPDAGKTLGREPGRNDTDGFGDWCGQPATPGAANGECICSTVFQGLPLVSTTLYDTWPTDEVFEACDTFSLSFADPSDYPPEDFPPFSLEPGVTFTVRAGRAVIFNSGTNIPNGASLTIEIDPQLRQ